MTQKKKLSIFSFFSGVGFLDLGFEMSGFNVQYVNELIPSFVKAYKYSRHQMGIPEPEFGFYEGSVGDLIESENMSGLINKSKKAGNLVGFIAGPPCPDFSVGGKNRGRNGERGKLSQAYMNLIAKHRPDFFLFENVKGLWRTKVHREFYEELKTQMIECGYVLTERLINAIEYGAPQDRDRIILLGFNRNILNNAVSPTENVMVNGTFPWESKLKFHRDEVFNLNWPETSVFNEDSELIAPSDIPIELTVEYWFKKNNVYKHPNSKHVFTPRAGLKKFKLIAEGDDKKKSYKRLHRWRYSPTAAYGNNEVHLHPYKARRITVAESLATQSLPANFELPADVSLSDMFKMIGNGVPYLAAKGIAETIYNFLKEQKAI